jgi:ubiquinone/menaquinone biosynthesis C-methylase UbiE
VTLQPERVRDMFDRISPSYDRMNLLMSMGRDGRWRRLGVRASRAQPGDAALDVCCGTGDFAVELRRAVGPSGRVVGLDFSPQMLAVARRKCSAVECATCPTTAADSPRWRGWCAQVAASCAWR